MGSLKLLLWILIIMVTTPAISADFLINCGLPKSTTAASLDQRLWSSDDDPTFSPPNINVISSAVKATGSGDGVPYTVARMFNSTLKYSFPITSPGPKFLRLYFSSNTSYNDIPPFQFSLSLEANNLTLLRNFSPYLNSLNPIPTCVLRPSNILFYEFHLVLERSTETLNLTFSPGNSSSFGFINGIEIVSSPDGLYINTAKLYDNVDNPSIDYTMLNTSGFQTAYRLNVGGTTVQPGDDAGHMGRTWYKDDDCIAGGFGGVNTYPTVDKGLSGIKFSRIPDYTAPKIVYATERFIGVEDPNKRERMNLMWGFEVDAGFDYLVRLHFCEEDRRVTTSGTRVFVVYLKGKRVDKYIDVWKLSGGRGSPIYQDFVVHVDGSTEGDSSNGTKVPLVLALLPMIDTPLTDVLLNGLEILKLSNPDRNFAVPNPPSPFGSTEQNPSPSSSPKSSSKAIVGGALGGGVLLFLATLACVINRRRANNLKMVSTTTSSDAISSLPTGLCHRFSLAQIRSATSDFDKAAIIGKGGFGTVYRGTIDIGGGGGATTVAIKRLNPESRQGVYEFRTEIEMLSRLRHAHLVSLVGYCEEQSEMIIVYEYMPRGTLREHLICTCEKQDNDNTFSPLSWKQRLMICIGASRGLHYLHTCAKQPIIHRDIKSSNILLDEKWTAKVSDFGLSKVGPASEMGFSHVSTMVKGSFGYMDPEYFRLQQLTEKSDVYSFGVVLFEVLCARAVVDPNLPRKEVNLALWARSHYRSGTLDSIIDPNLKGQIAAECLRKFGEIAEMCVRNERNQRPSMGDVVACLEFALQLQQTAEKNNNISDTGPVQGLEDYSSGKNINGSEIGDELSSNSGENLSLIAITTTTTANSEKHIHPYLR